MKYATSPDGTRIAYQVFGDGPPLILLHGGGQSSQVWNDHGYVEALGGARRLIAVDARGHGQSDKPVERRAYAIEAVMSDVLGVADAESAEQFELIGYSYGGNIGRYLAARTDRILRFVLLGIGFGRGAPDSLKQRVDAFLAPFAAVLGPEPDPSGLAEDARAAWEHGAIRPVLAWFGALLDWPGVEPWDLKPETLWLLGSRNETGGLQSLEKYGASLPPNVRVEILDGLDHSAELTASHVTLPSIRTFLGVGSP